MTYLQI